MNRLTKNNANKIIDSAARPVSTAVSDVAIVLVVVKIRGGWVEIEV